MLNRTVKSHIPSANEHFRLSEIKTGPVWRSFIKVLQSTLSWSAVNYFCTCLCRQVFSKLFYCSTVWSGTYKQNIHKLQLMQNFAARILTDTRKYDHITLALKALGWLTIDEQLRLRDVIMMYKCVNKLAPAYLSCKLGKRFDAHAYNLRNSDHLNTPKCRTVAAQRGFF